MRYGYFDNVNREYVIDKVDVPVSWTNYLGIKDMCAVISHNAGGYLFYKSAEYHRITRFRPNAVPLDRPGHYVYIRDNDSKDYWSISWQPVGKDLGSAKYETRHGLSYSKFSTDYSDIEASQTLFIPINDDVELWAVRLKNNSGKKRNLTIANYAEFSFHLIEIDNQNFQMSLYCAGSNYADGIIEYEQHYDPEKFHYMASSFAPDSYDTLRDAFLGNYRTETNPIGIENGYGQNTSELGNNHCASLQKRITLEPGEEKRVVFMLGFGKRAKGLEIKEKYSDPANVDSAFAELAKYWDSKLSKYQVNTPHKGLNTFVNIWNLYQAETNVVWSRFASFIEVGGRTGLGYRDTAQDVMCVPHTNPEKVKARIVELLRGLVKEGYGLHLFDPEWFNPDRPAAPSYKSPTVVPHGNLADKIHGLDHTCSDDALWLIKSICDYVKETGEVSFFDEIVTYADGGFGTVYEHMTKILDFSTKQIGKTGICLGLRADWNDCLNLGGGESAMVSFLHYWALLSFVEASEFLGRNEDTEKYNKIADIVKAACERELWDGEWYIRGITAKGIKIGCAADEEGKVHLESNTWAVVSGAASSDRAIKAMDSVDKYLYSDWGLHLNGPSYTKPNDDIGFMGRVYPGIKENGAIFSHPNPWAWIAECELGRGDRAMKFYDSLLPYNQNDKIETRQSEPYSYCQFIMGREHTAHGRARHPWLTGSAGWAYVAATRHILGIRQSFTGLIIDPCIPSDWKEFEVTRKWRGAQYNIKISNPGGVMKGVKSITLNGRLCGKEVPVQQAGSINDVFVVMG